MGISFRLLVLVSLIVVVLILVLAISESNNMITSIINQNMIITFRYNTKPESGRRSEGRGRRRSTVILVCLFGYSLQGGAVGGGCSGWG